MSKQDKPILRLGDIAFVNRNEVNDHTVKESPVRPCLKVGVEQGLKESDRDLISFIVNEVRSKGFVSYSKEGKKATGIRGSSTAFVPSQKERMFVNAPSPKARCKKPRSRKSGRPMHLDSEGNPKKKKKDRKGNRTVKRLLNRQLLALQEYLERVDLGFTMALDDGPHCETLFMSSKNAEGEVDPSLYCDVSRAIAERQNRTYILELITRIEASLAQF